MGGKIAYLGCFRSPLSLLYTMTDQRRHHSLFHKNCWAVMAILNFKLLNILPHQYNNILIEWLNQWWVGITRTLATIKSVPQVSVFEWKFGSYISLFKPLLLSLFNVPSWHIYKYSCLFNQSSLLVSWVGAWAKIWNLIFLYSCFSCFIIMIYHRALV